MEYRVLISDKAVRNLDELETRGMKLRESDEAEIASLAETPFPSGKYRKMRGMAGVWRIAFRNRYRIVYAVDEKGRIVTVIEIKHRKDAYR